MSRRRRGGSTGDRLAIFSFIIIIMLGAALATVLILSAVPGPPGLRTAALWLERVAIALALTIPIALSYREARVRSRAWFAVWIVSLVLIIILYFLNIAAPTFGWW